MFRVGRFDPTDGSFRRRGSTADTCQGYGNTSSTGFLIQRRTRRVLRIHALAVGTTSVFCIAGVLSRGQVPAGNASCR
uniref:Transmembrane protein n=1 Tax=Steinernema glaseri TaxID=37863 RepID=A0A1I8A2N1_9BILA